MQCALVVYAGRDSRRTTLAANDQSSDTTPVDVKGMTETTPHTSRSCSSSPQYSSTFLPTAGKFSTVVPRATPPNSGPSWPDHLRLRTSTTFGTMTAAELDFVRDICVRDATISRVAYRPKDHSDTAPPGHLRNLGARMPEVTPLPCIHDVRHRRLRSRSRPTRWTQSSRMRRSQHCRWVGTHQTGIQRKSQASSKEAAWT